MKSKLFPILMATGMFFCSCSGITYYVVRHAERSSSPSNDPALSEAGMQRASLLEARLKKEKIAYIFSTNTLRARSTAGPLSRAAGIPILTYGPQPDSVFINQLRRLKKNVLIVGHSNTVDDIVNGLCADIRVPSDLPEAEYDNLFVIQKKGRKVKFHPLKYGAVSSGN